VYLCENAIFFVEPIDNLNKLYTQRQRWQIGEIEVSHMFLKNKMPDGSNILGNFMIRVLLYDHTFAFPRMIWYFALIFLLFMNYPFYLVFGSIFIIYILYVLSAFLFYINVKMYLKQYKRIKSYYSKKVYLVFLMPLFNFLVFWIRFAGIINCINGNSKWKTLNLRDEYNIFCSLCKNDFSFLSIIMNKIRRVINDE
jgi:putative glycosyltransferase (exosortase G-associated)